MTRIGDALLRVRDGGGLMEAEPHSPLSAPAWIRPLEAHAERDLWKFDTPATSCEPIAPSVDMSLVADPVSPEPDAAAAAAGLARGAVPAATAASDVSPAIAIDSVVNPAILERIVTSGAVPFQAVEHYRRLAGTLHEVQADRGIKVVVITSAVSGEGKSLTAANLALTLSESYRRRVLLLDADLRRPTLHDIFAVPGGSGLSEGLRRSRSSEFTTFQLSAGLTFLPAGRPDADPMASLTSARMKQLVAEARGKFDWVIIDTPPVTLMPDAKLLAGMADSVLLVVGAGTASLDALKQAVKAIGRKKILGAVFNRAEPEPDSGYYHQP